eukprot:CAMPEP_0176497486 /NCGR_PEP_ID=MMETSP0200_2-20121128/11747_1 /TAXON_ID=947934 /ORGANISM="Chaetoceros sp., Strain GSL56" /LENGTH=1364 /DNA_ID=CAMNT_0017895497 /DNA_START=108 /DNA_END=4199 /DNA_ORIENTATION=+
MLWPPFQLAPLFGKEEQENKDHATSSSSSRGKLRNVTSHCAFVHIDEVPPLLVGKLYGDCVCKDDSTGTGTGTDNYDEMIDDSNKEKEEMTEIITNLTRSIKKRPCSGSSSSPSARESPTSSNVTADYWNVDIGKTPIRSNSSTRRNRTRHGTSSSRNNCTTELDYDDHATKNNDHHNRGNQRIEINLGSCNASSSLEPPRIQSIVKNYQDDRDYDHIFDNDSMGSVDTTAMFDESNAVEDKVQDEKEESYEKMMISIEKNSGIISFTKAPFDKDGGDNYSRNGQPVDEVDLIQSIDDNHYKKDKERTSDGNEAEQKDNYGIGPTFQLIPTKYQTHKENKRKLYHQTRKACLEAAVEAYKSASKDIPDMILAQLNDHRNYLSGNRNNTSIRNKTDEKCSHPTNKMVTNRDTSSRENCNAKMIKLHKTDEIHVAPCQCALRLLGMENQKKKLDTSHSEVAQMKPNNSNSIIGRNRNIDKDDHDNFVGEFRHSRTASTINDDRLVMKLMGNYKNVATSMVRTSSAQVTSSTVESKKNMRDMSASKDMNATLKRLITANATNPSRSESDAFYFSEFHEITLIRNYDVTSYSDEKFQRNHSDDGCVKWDAVTFRCSNHDELDLLVKDLRDSSKAKVVPFSSNPKHRLKWVRAQMGGVEKNTSRSKIYVSRDKERMHGHISGETVTIMSLENNPDTRNKSVIQDCAMPTPAAFPNALVSTSPEKERRDKRKPFDLNFNKMEFCELCDLTFTLLTRRHHCRKCERSCCGHCSRILIVKGCDEKRYCNWCASEILQKQSYALRGRLLPKDNDNSLPGKVHGACFRLGVGLTGRLPHWKAFLHPNLEDRPAVGRITIEVIEAIALPSVDMVNGKVDPYVRATITGYDRDMKWTLRQWLQSYRYSMCSRFCSATLSPQWRGTGKLGGELLTLPVISTAGAVLRLEVLHYNVLTTSRDKDPVLGVVEIPLSDLPNANLRHPGGIEVETSRGRRKNLEFDGYCDRWYRLLPSDEFDSKYILLSKPILSPIDAKTSKKEGSRKVGMQSLEEVGKRMLGLAIAPVEWFASAIKLDLPARRPEAVCRQHKARSMIHVRLKLNASIFGDILSHAWFPPVRPFPLPPPYDPEILLSRVLQVGKQTEPYRNIIQYIELCIKWKHPPKVCILAYVIFGFHVAIFPYLLPLFHVYIFIFLWIRLRKMQSTIDDDEVLRSLQCHDSFDGLGNCQQLRNKNDIRDKDAASDDVTKIEKTRPSAVPSIDESDAPNISEQAHDNVTMHNSPSLIGLSYQRKEEWRNRGTVAKAKIIQSSSNTSLVDSRDRLHGSRNITDQNSEEEVTKLNIAIHWIAKRVGDNKGLEVLQFKLGMLGRDLGNVNSVW